MRKIDLIALDLDGTFLDPAGEISPASLEAVRTARAAGIKVVLSTGRSGAEAAYFSNLAGCDGLAVCLGGSALCDARTGSHLRRWDLPEETGRRALELCLDRDIELMIFAGEEILLTPSPAALSSAPTPSPFFTATLLTLRIPWPIWRSTACPSPSSTGIRSRGAIPWMNWPLCLAYLSPPPTTTTSSWSPPG